MFAQRGGAHILNDALAQVAALLLKRGHALDDGQVFQALEFQDEFVHHIHQVARAAYFLDVDETAVFHDKDRDHAQHFTDHGLREIHLA